MACDDRDVGLVVGDQSGWIPGTRRKGQRVADARLVLARRRARPIRRGVAGGLQSAQACRCAEPRSFGIETRGLDARVRSALPAVFGRLNSPLAGDLATLSGRTCR